MMLTTASKVNAAKRYARNGQYPEAAVIAEKIRLSKVSSIHELSALAGIFLRVKQYDEAKAVYLEMYSRAKTHKVMVGLIDLCLKTQEPKLAEKYLREFRKMEPENPERLVFRYRVDCMLGKSNEYLLKSLTKLKEEDYTDIWALELAKIYFKENDMVACAKECRDILLWFPDSEVVPKAKVLLGACEDTFEAAETEPEEAVGGDAADAPQERAGAGASVDVVEITNAESSDSETPRSYETEAELALEASIADAVAGMLDGGEAAEEFAAEELAAEELAAEEEAVAGAQTIPTPAPILYDRIIYDDDDDEDDEEEYVIRDYFEEKPAEAEDTQRETAGNIAAEPMEQEPLPEEPLPEEPLPEEPLPVIELPVIGVPMEEPAGEAEPEERSAAEESAVQENASDEAAAQPVPDLSQIRVEELVFDPDSSAWEEPDDGLLRDDDQEKWMQKVDITAKETEPPKEEPEATERELTEAALAAMFREDDVAIERALYDLLKKD